jgi:Mg2+ and Co2+ transporter CorA
MLGVHIFNNLDLYENVIDRIVDIYNSKENKNTNKN